MSHEPSEQRRRFLKTAGQVAIATPPAMALLMSTSGRHYAMATSSHVVRAGKTIDTVKEISFVERDGVVYRDVDVTRTVTKNGVSTTTQKDRETVAK